MASNKIFNGNRMLTHILQFTLTVSSCTCILHKRWRWIQIQV